MHTSFLVCIVPVMQIRALYEIKLTSELHEM